MNSQQVPKAPRVMKESKNKIRVEFERTPLKERLKSKFLSMRFLKNVVWVIFRLVLLIGISYVILFPFFAKISGSFMSREDFVDVTVKLIPKYPTLDTYKAIISQNKYFEALLNTLTLSVLCGLIQTFICCLIGYGLAKFKFKGNKLIFFLVIFTMVVPHRTLQLSMFMKFRYFDILGIFNLLGGGVFEGLNVIPFTSLNLNNSYWPLALLSLGGLAFKNGLYIFMMRQFFHGVPDELEESAYIDGSGTFRTFIQIILPLSVPMMITIFLFAFSWQWTDNFYTTIFFTKASKVMMPNIIQIPRTLDTAYAAQNLYESAIRNTCGLLILAPLLLVYVFMQRYLIGGIERSGIVG
ncbi:MAG: carbohydrate ABC transporter permease [Clostridiales bacterium]|nr:carbohydrate ABC transporter permease [Clostridiales bacterium]